MAETILKVSVLADGSLRLDGQPATLAELSQAVKAAPQDAAVWYYREDAAGEGPPIALDVMKVIAERRLRIRLSSKADFSDTVAPAPGAAQVFAAMRQRAAQRQLVILRPDGRQIALPALEKASAPAEALAAVERMLPSSAPRNVAAVGDTSWTMEEKPNAREAGRAIPFFGLLMGFTAIGHTVWIFGQASLAALLAGCRDADLVIIDSARLEPLAEGWASQVASVMRNPQIVVYDRATQKLRKP